MNIAELLAIPASMFPDQEIIWFEGKSLSYERLQDTAGRMAGALRTMGVQAGDRVAVIQTNTPDVISVLFAAAGIGAVFVPLNYRARQDELAHMLRVAQPRVLLAGDRYADMALAVARQLEDEGVSAPVVAAIESRSGSLQHLHDLAAQEEPLFAEDVDDDALAVLMFTSGTTAAAKAVMLAHGDLMNFVFGTTEPADGSDKGSVLLAAPLYHIAGLSATLAAAFAGRRIVAMRQFQEEEWLRLVADQRVSHAFLVPTMMKRVLDHPSLSQADLSSLSVLSYGAAPMPVTVIRRAIEMLPSTVQFINAFGQTETASTVTMLGPDDHRLEGTPDQVELKVRRLKSIGRPLADVELAIIGEDGALLSPGQVGEVAVQTGRTMRGYYGQEEATSRALQGDGWLRTGDLGWMDEDGYVFLTGRKSDLIIRGGENIAPEEIELVLESHPDVEEVAVVGVPDEEWGERIAAVVVPRAGTSPSAEALTAHCRERLASFKKPETIVFIAALPRNALGKVLRSQLRTELSEGVAPSPEPTPR